MTDTEILLRNAMLFFTFFSVVIISSLILSVPKALVYNTNVIRCFFILFLEQIFQTNASFRVKVSNKVYFHIRYRSDPYPFLISISRSLKSPIYLSEWLYQLMLCRQFLTRNKSQSYSISCLFFADAVPLPSCTSDTWAFCGYTHSITLAPSTGF